MNLVGLQPGDIVQIQKKGWNYYAIVKQREKQQLDVLPLDPRCNYFSATAREVVAIYKKQRSRST